MKLERAVLLAAAETIKPALATKENFEDQTHIWSDGETLTAYNSTSLGITIPFKSELKGGIRGSVLLGILSNSRAKEVEITAQKEEAEIKAGRTRLRLALLPADRALWTFPSLSKTKGSSLPTGFLDALKAVLISTGNGTTAPEQLGVTISGEGGQVHLFTTDSETIAWKTAVRPKDWADGRVIVPTPFIEQLIRLGDDKTMLYFVNGTEKNWMVEMNNEAYEKAGRKERLKSEGIKTNGIIAATGNGTRIFARIVDSPKPLDFAKIATDNMKQTDPVAIPTRLRLALERASVMLNGQSSEFMELGVERDRMNIYAKTPYGELRDSMVLDRELPKMSCKLNPNMLKRALPLCDKIGFSEHSVVLTGERFVYLAATAA